MSTSSPFTDSIGTWEGQYIDLWILHHGTRNLGNLIGELIKKLPEGEGVELSAKLAIMIADLEFSLEKRSFGQRRSEPVRNPWR